MILFSEVYNSYYQILQSLLRRQGGFTLDDLKSKVKEQGFEESLLYLIPKLSSQEWSICEKNGTHYICALSEEFYVPLTTLQKSYVKTILLDKRMKLFLDDGQREALLLQLSDVEVLWEESWFHYYDRFSDGDDYSNPNYIACFRTLLSAIEQQCFVDIEYTSKTNHRVHHHYLPARLEYSVKNDKFRLLAMEYTKNKHMRFEILNLERIVKVSLMDKKPETAVDLNALIRETYYKEPVRLLIHDKRNALERAMLQFANYDKNTTKLSEDTYECLIYYNEKQETELLIEVLSFGPMIKVMGNERFLLQLKKRLNRQKRRFSPLC